VEEVVVDAKREVEVDEEATVAVEVDVMVDVMAVAIVCRLVVVWFIAEVTV
jgi:hypothetical protein